MKTTPTTGGEAPSPEAEALPTLPVVAWLRENKKTHDVRAVRERNPNAEWAYDFTALTPHAPAEAAIVALRAERDEAYSARDAAINLANSRFDSMRAAQAEVAELQKERDALRAARFAYASEFPPNVDGEPDVGSIHANIRALKARASLLGDGGTL